MPARSVDHHRRSPTRHLRVRSARPAPVVRRTGTHQRIRQTSPPSPFSGTAERVATEGTRREWLEVNYGELRSAPNRDASRQCLLEARECRRFRRSSYRGSRTAPRSDAGLLKVLRSPWREISAARDVQGSIVWLCWVLVRIVVQ